MDAYERDVSIIEAWPVLPGAGIVETATRSAEHLLKSEDVKKTMKHIYCDLPISALLRGGFSMMVQLLDDGVRQHNRSDDINPAPPMN